MRTIVSTTLALALLMSVSDSQTNGMMSILSSDSIHFIVTHPSGKRTGADPRGIIADPLYRVTFFDEIPKAHYAFSGTTDLEGNSETESHEFTFDPYTGQDEGTYTLQAIGIGLSRYWIDSHVYQPNVKAFKLKRFSARGVIEKDSTITYRFAYFSSLDSNLIFVKVVDARSLLQDIAAMRKMNWISSQSTGDKYSGLIGVYSTQLGQNNVAGARSALTTFLQNIASDSSVTLTTDASISLRPDVDFLLRQLPMPAPGLLVELISSNGTKLTGGSLQYYDGTWKDATNNNDGTFSIATSLRALSLRMTYEFATQTKSNVTVGSEPVVFQTVNAQVMLQSSQGAAIDTGAVQYYFSSWKTLGTTANGVASKELLPGNYTFRMTYASATNDKQQDIGANPVVLFQTVSASVQLKSSQGTLIDQGSVQYYFSSWKNFGVTTSGVAMKELLPGNYTFRMTYAAATSDKQQNIGTNATVVFQTVNAAVQLKNSQGNFIDQGMVQYYFSSWNNLGNTSNGVAAKELLPGNYTFRMTYAAATNDKAQNIGTNPSVVFQTVNASVQLKNSQGSFIDQGTVQYYFNSWNNLGATTNGVATKELLPGNYTFRMTYESVSNDKVQNISTNGTVSFSTVLCTVSVKNSQSQPVNNATISYYSGAWRQIGPTVNGQVTKELLPANLTFRMTLGTASQDKVQNIGTSSLVEFVTQ